MPKIELLPESEQDAILMRLIGVAWVKILELVRACYREDTLHDLIVEWLASLRAGTWSHPPEGLDAYVEKVVRQRRVESLRHRKRTLQRDAVHLEIIAGAPREWMSQDLKIEADRIDAFADAVRATLPRKYVRAHRMVRDDGMTYAEAARTLRTSVANIHKFVAVVQRAFREALRGSGVEPMRSVRGGRPPRATARQIKRLYRKREVGARRVAGIDRTARVVVDVRPEATAFRTLSPVESKESTVPPKQSPVLAIESPAMTNVSPAGANDPTVTTDASPARPHVALVTTNAELERRERTPEATNMQLVARGEATETAHVQPVAHDETSEATFEMTAQVNVAAVCAKAEAAPMVGSSADPTLPQATAAVALVDRLEETDRVSAQSRTVTRTTDTRLARHVVGR